MAYVPRSYKSRPRLGAFRVCAAKLPPETARKLRAYAIGNGVTISSVITGLVTEFLKVNQGLNLVQTQRDAPTDAVLPMPVLAGQSEKTARNAAIPGLKAIDAARKATRDAGTMRD
jgi:hypothetical protein